MTCPLIYRSQLLLCLSLLGTLLLPGCGSGSGLPGETGRLTGVITYNSEAIPEGSALLLTHIETGIVAIGVTDAQGRFQARMRNAADILCGKYVVNITPPGEPAENSEKLPEAWYKVPRKYWSNTTSNEFFEVAPGQNQYELILTD